MSASQENVHMGSESDPGPVAPPPPPPYAGGPWVGGPTATPPWTGPTATNPGRRSPVLAGILSAIVPGIGQLYLGQFQRGLVFALIFTGCIVALSSGTARGIEPLFGIAIGFTYIFGIVDAVQRACLCNQIPSGASRTALPEDQAMSRGRPSLFGGLVVMAIGLILLLNSRFDIDLDWLADWWPAFIVVLGAHMVWRSWRKRQA